MKALMENFRKYLRESPNPQDSFMSALYSDPNLHLALFPNREIGFKMKFADDCNVSFLIKKSDDLDSVILSIIETTESEECRGKGYGSKTMKKIIELADKYGATIHLIASPSGGMKMSEKSLRKWYSKFGFKAFDEFSQRMVRVPS